MERKQPISATIDKELVDWMDKEIKNKKEYRNRSHLIEIAVESLRGKK